MRGFGLTREDWAMIDAALVLRFENDATRIAHPGVYQMFRLARDRIAPAAEGGEVELFAVDIDTIGAALQRQYDRGSCPRDEWEKAARLWAKLVETAREQGTHAEEWDTRLFRKAPVPPKPTGLLSGRPAGGI